MLGSAPSYDHYIHGHIFTVVKAVDLDVLILYARVYNIHCVIESPSRSLGSIWQRDW